MKLSKNFSLSELTKSQSATRLGIDNIPTMAVIDNLQQLVDNVLQPLRDSLDRPIIISSGYRSPDLNKAIGGSPTSDHTKGQAADIEVFGISNKDLAEHIRDNFKFTQLILEFPSRNDPSAGWVHVSYNPKDLKCQVLTAERIGSRVVYRAGLVLS